MSGARDPAGSVRTIAGPDLGLRAPAGLSLLVAVHERATEDPWGTWFVDAGAALFAAVAELAADATDAAPVRIAVVAVQDEPATPEEAAAMDAGLAVLQGATVSLAAELGAGVRLNLIRVDRPSVGGLAGTLAYLASPEAAYVTASALDLEAVR